MARKKTKRSSTTPKDKVREAAKLLKMAADPTRLQILLALAESGEINVGDLAEVVNQSRPAITHHVTLLRHGGLVSPRRAGFKIFYSLGERGKALAAIVRGFVG
jgi:DNA-binding transcriptional ArsR family regulator